MNPMRTDPQLAAPAEIAAGWRPAIVLKRDVFSTVERGTFMTARGEVDAVLRRLDTVPWWAWPVARWLFAREREALKAAAGLGIAPPLLYASRRLLVRGFIDGVTLHLARPEGDTAYFRSAKRALRLLHRTGICHNDLNKEQNWIRGRDGRAYLTDFQLASRFKRRGKLFRIAAYEDLRHLLKHKRRYVPDALTPAELRVLARKSWIDRLWMATGKKLYYAVTRGLFRFVDREGGGLRLVRDAPVLAERLKAHPQVRDAAVVAYPDRRIGTGLYAFVEAPGVEEIDLLMHLAIGADAPKPPEQIQIVDALPRDAQGALHGEVLQLVAMNQIDLIEPLIANEAERSTVARIVADRRNLRDRTAF
ncbi:MAG: serine/threonine protein kinase [Alphaproteobacteria bacterium]|nr:serine/threonine protein kinase [Alphaproteobacteria bacterium]